MKKESSTRRTLHAYVSANAYTDKGGVSHDWDYLEAKVYEEYEQKYQQLTGKAFNDTLAEREVVARVMQSFFGDAALGLAEGQVDTVAFVNAFARRNRNAATRMWHRLSQMATRLKEDIKNSIAK